jgi:heme O synthase-like polyprenyltransferase
MSSVTGVVTVLLGWAALTAAIGTRTWVQVVGLTLVAICVWFHGRTYEKHR